MSNHNQDSASMDYKFLFETMPNLCIILKPNPPEFTIINANNAHIAATMVVRDEIIGKGLFDVFPENPDKLVNGMSDLRRSLERAIETKQPDIMPVLKYEIRDQAGNGKEFVERYWTPSNTPVLNAAGEIIYILNQVEDVTATVQLKENMQNFVLAAENEIQEKSKFIQQNQERISLILEALLKYTVMDFSQKLEISEKGDELDAIAAGLNSLIDELQDHVQRLKQTNVNLEYANKELDSFSYSVSHDLRAPLRAINGYSEVLLEDYHDKLDDEGRQSLDIIIRNARKMGDLIDDLLTFSRVGKQNLTRVMLNMNTIVDTVIRECIPPGQQNQPEFKVAALENTMGDSSMLKQVVANLLSNAIKYSGKKEKPVIEIGSDKKDGHIVYYVKDNGSGFDMKYYDKLFGVFQRLHSSSEFEGTGVGLALVQRIIKKHEGEVWAEAVPGEGATFYFSLPLN